jgi:hypothetical protein
VIGLQVNLKILAEVHANTKSSTQDDSVKGFENLENFFFRYLNEKYGVEDIAMAVAHR